ncbi:hypothetical protein AB5N19_06750 [Seiridium cardinale]|uniref:Hydantoinase B/oxoprolinase domain-containing protein n=1 Tax=Seiridium cardinale TaxID=138064 RepID=A0ABR2XL30_9PEZI
MRMFTISRLLFSGKERSSHFVANAETRSIAAGINKQDHPCIHNERAGLYQRVIDTLLKAYNAVAAFQGCASSFGWGMGGRNPKTGEIEPGWNYGESIGGGTGAGPGWHGEHAIHAHSTNTRMTDAEVIEKRTQVIVRRYEIAHGTGGRGKWNGGDGITRESEARIPLKSSILSERRVFPPYGLEGGNPGSIGRNFVFRENG